MDGLSMRQDYVKQFSMKKFFRKKNGGGGGGGGGGSEL